MPIPAYPENREEQYLHRIATGEGDIPAYPENRTEQYLDTIARNGGGGSGSGLPEVSAEDNGDVLTVVDGAWAKAAPGGGGVLVCNLDMQTGALDKTWQEIHDAEFAVVIMTMSSAINYYVISGLWWEEGSYDMVFTAYDGQQMSELNFHATSADGYPAMQGG